MRHFILEIPAVLHFLALTLLAVYGLHRILLLVAWLRVRGAGLRVEGVPDADLPFITVQLPLFNERFVAARIIDAAAVLDWPREKLEIQVLDDSDDETRQIVEERVAFWSARGADIRILRRFSRNGFKAGALQEGLRSARGEFLAVFDADFIPGPDFLRRVVPSLTDPSVGMVQARWSFINEEHSWLTRLQAILLRAHFSLEHLVRSRTGCFFNFNGTAGVWRKSAIELSGGWSADTVTEDLDLSYRAQMGGWRFAYLDEVSVPSELPVTVASFRRQQQRWAKGSMQVARNVLPSLWKKDLPLQVKIEACFHLLGNGGWLAGAVITLTLYPAILWRTGVGTYQLLRLEIPLLILTSGAILFFHACAAHGSGKSLRWLPLLPFLAIGIAPSIAGAVVRGLFFKGGDFHRTPKFGIRSGGLPQAAAEYLGELPSCSAIDFVLLLYTMIPLVHAWQRKTLLALPFLALFPLAFFFIFLRGIGSVKAGCRR